MIHTSKDSSDLARAAHITAFLQLLTCTVLRTASLLPEHSHSFWYSRKGPIAESALVSIEPPSPPHPTPINVCITKY